MACNTLQSITMLPWRCSQAQQALTCTNEGRLTPFSHTSCLTVVAVQAREGLLTSTVVLPEVVQNASKPLGGTFQIGFDGLKSAPISIRSYVDQHAHGVALDLWGVVHFGGPQFAPTGVLSALLPTLQCNIAMDGLSLCKCAFFVCSYRDTSLNGAQQTQLTS
eukprot:4187916-Amphidinium_carterae.1